MNSAVLVNPQITDNETGRDRLEAWWFNSTFPFAVSQSSSQNGTSWSPRRLVGHVTVPAEWFRAFAKHNLTVSLSSDGAPRLLRDNQTWLAFLVITGAGGSTAPTIGKFKSIPQPNMISGTSLRDCL